MGAFSETRVLDQPPALLYRVVADIASYPLFLPWCKSALRTDPPAGIEAEADCSYWQLVVGWGVFQGDYVSCVRAQPRGVEGGRITAQAVAGVLRELDSTWDIQGVQAGGTGGGADSLSKSRVEFSLSFSFRGLLMEKAAEAAFAGVAPRLADAFAKRAEEVQKNSTLLASKS